MIPPFLLFGPVFASVVILVALFLYVLFRARHHPTKYVFLCLLVCMWATLYTVFFRYYPAGQPAAIPLALRLQWVGAAFIPPLLLHLSYYSLTRKWKQWLKLFLALAYLVSILALPPLLVDQSIFTGFVLRGSADVRLATPVVSPLGAGLAFFGLLQIVGLLILLYQAQRTLASPVERLRARRLAFAVWGFMAYWIGNIAAVAFLQMEPPEIVPAQDIMVLSYLLIAGISLSLSYTLLKHGWPAPVALEGQELSFAATWAPVIVLAGWIAYEIDRLAVGQEFAPWLIPPLLTGLLIGALLIRPHPEARPGRLGLALRDTPATRLEAQLKALWNSVVQSSSAGQTVLPLLEQLRPALGASFVILARRAGPAADGKLRFVPELTVAENSGEPGPHVETIWLEAETLDHPLVNNEPGPDADAEFEVLSPPQLRSMASLVCPIAQRDDWEGLLIIGQASQGGIYTNTQIGWALECADAISATWTVDWLQKEQRRWSRPAAPELERPGHAAASAGPQPIIRIEALGDFGVFVQGQSLADSPFVSDRARTLLAYLIWVGERGATAEQLSTLLWPDLEPARARNSLNVAMHHLRRVFEPGLAQAKQSRYLVYSSGRYTFCRAPDVWVDADEFTRQVAAGQALLKQHEVRAGIDAIRQGVALYRGDYLAAAGLDLPVEVEPTRHALRRQFGDTCYAAIQGAAEGGLDDVVEEFLTALIRIDPWDTKAYHMLADHYAKRGQPGLARRYLNLLAEREAELGRGE